MPTPPRLRFRHLRLKLGLLYTGLFAAALTGLAAVIFVIAGRNAEMQVHNELVASGTVFDRLWAQRSAQLGGAAGLLARDFGFRAAVATGDKATIVSALVNLKQRMRVPVAFVLGEDGVVTGVADPRARAQAALLWQALDAGQTSGVVDLGGAARHVIAAPILAPAPIGWVVFATNLDAREMRGLERLSSIPIEAAVFQQRAGATWTMAGDSDAPAPALSTFIARALHSAVPSELDDPSGTAIALVKSLPTLAGAPPSVLLLRYPLARALANLRQLQWAIAIAGLLGLMATLLGTWRIAGSITQPIALLDRAAGRLANGGDAEVPVTSEDELGRLAISFNRMAEDIAERERQITRLAFNDTLTGLPNRALFQQHLARELTLGARSGALTALLCVDLNQLRGINDTLGHRVGDDLLRQVAVRLTDEAGDAFVARLIGDEFAIVVRVESGEHAERLARRVLNALAAPLEIEGHDLAPSASIGIAIAPDDGADASIVLKHADLALGRAKQLGRGAFSFFETALDERARARRQLESDLRVALREGQFTLFFQPLFDLKRNRIGAFETLLRWRHPTRELVSPTEFIPLAEETGQIVEIGAWVLREACRQATRWPDHVLVAVNVSSVQFARPGLSNVVLQALAASGLSPARLELEITESLFLEDSEGTLRLLHSLRGLGVRVALDDFGTGYSSLSYLQSFPFDKLKIDRAFVIDLLVKPGAGAIIKAIVDVAHALGMDVTAEGVEEPAQLEALRAHGCSSVQGYLFSRPVEGESVHRLLADDAGSVARAA